MRRRTRRPAIQLRRIEERIGNLAKVMCISLEPLQEIKSEGHESQSYKYEKEVVAHKA
jgi:hypothetical protein